MNHICRTVWNEKTQSWVAASELAKGRTKSNSSAQKLLLKTGILLSTLSAAFASPAMAFTSTVTNSTIDNEVVTTGTQVVSTGGVANNTTVNTGGSQTVNDGGITNATMLNGGDQTVANNGSSNNTTIGNGSTQRVANGGIANITVINGGGRQTLFSGGTSNAAIINGGLQSIQTNAIANDTTINTGGLQSVEGLATGTVIDGGIQDVYGTANITTVNMGGEQNVYGTADNTVINGGKQTVLYGGTANDTEVNMGGVQVVSYVGIANTTTINMGGSQTIENGGTANGTTINDGGWQFIDGGTAEATTINTGGNQAVINGTANGIIINAGGNQAIHAGGVANNTTIHTGGEQYVDAGAIVNNTLINGGTQLLFGTANDTTANAGEIYAGSGSILGGTTQINGTTTIGGEIITLDEWSTLVFNPSTQITVTTPIMAAGFGTYVNKTGPGTLVLNTQTDTGPTTILGGRLIVGDTAAQSSARIGGGMVSVTNGGTLSGHGQISNSLFVATGGKLAPGGDSVGTISVGSAAFADGSIFEVRVNADGTNDKLVTDSTFFPGPGSVQIDDGAKLSIVAGAGAWNDTTSYTIIEAELPVSGTFTEVDSNLAFLTPTVDYSNPNQVNLTMERNGTGFSEVGEGDNEKGTGSGIESLGPNNAIYQQIVGMNALQANNAYNNLSGEIHASVKSALLENSRYPRHAVLEHLDRTAKQNIPETSRGLWVNTWAHGGHLKEDGHATRLDNKGAGFIVGADLYQNGTTTIGAALGYEQTDLKAKDLRNSDANTKAIHIMGYGKTSVGSVDLKAGVGYSRLKVDSKRNIAVGSMASQNSAKYNAGLVQIFVEGSHTFDINERVRITPYTGLLYQNISADGFTEKGVAAQLQGRSSNDHSTSTTLGIRGEWDVNSTSNLYANLGWQHSFGNSSPRSALNFIGGTPYNVKGVQTNRNSALIGIGVNAQLRPNLTLNVAYDGQFGNRSVDHGVKVGLSFIF